MMTEQTLWLTKLRTMIRDRGAEGTLYACIQDLLEHGLALDRFSPGEPTPQRQDITQYLAAWSRQAGLSDEECRAWLIDYCVEVLSPLSRRSPASIRHSTKSNIKYIYGSSVEFVCAGATNRFRARCCPDCPAHGEMEVKRAALAERARNPPSLRPLELPGPMFVPRVRDVYKEQFAVALQLVEDEIAKGTKKKRILELLEERGLKTRTGRKWTGSILHSELVKRNQTPAGAPSASKESSVPESPSGQGTEAQRENC